jgi:Tol biopolymer transport system component
MSRSRLATSVLVALLVGATIAVLAPSALAAFPGTNGRIAFSRDINSGDIFTMAANGTDQSQLTSSAAVDQMPSYSPDGTQIAFARNAGGTWSIVVMDTDGTDQATVVPGAAGVTLSDPSFSPDGTQIAFGRSAGGVTEVWLVNTDGTDPGPLTLGNDPVWSPDGTQIAYELAVGGFADIFKVNADGTNATNVSNTAGFTDLYPDWSPNGAQIAFSSNRDGDFEVFKMQANGTLQTQLTFNAVVDFDPAWAPDGTRIAWTHVSGPIPTIWKMRSDGQLQVQLTTVSELGFPSWQPIPIPPPPVPGTLEFSAPTYFIGEAGPSATITVNRTGGTDGTVSVTCSTSPGTATAGVDYTSVSSTLTFVDGDASEQCIVPITNDSADEPDETVNLALTNPTGGASLGAQNTAVLTIADDDPPGPPPPPPPPVCTINGTAGNDVINGTSGDDVICGLGGNDVIDGKKGHDIVVGNGGRDTLTGGPGNDDLVGGAGNDTLKGIDSVNGNDDLDGGSGTDTCESDVGDSEVACEA